MTPVWKSALAAPVALAAVLALASCGTPNSDPSAAYNPKTNGYQRVLPNGTVFEPAGSVPASVPQFTGLLGSLRPDDRKAEERVPQIVARGRVIIGVDQSQNLLSFRDPVSGELKGFEIDLAREISQDIFGRPDRVDFRFVDTADKVTALESEQIDILIRSQSITRKAQDTVAFSTPYLSASTRMLVLESSGLSSITDLSGRTACAVSGSTSIEQIRARNNAANIMRTEEWADCLLLLQQGIVDAIVANDTILAGMAEQDPYARIVGDPLTQETYGAAIAKPGVRHDTVGLIRQVNSTIERIQRNGTWWRMYNQWLSGYKFVQGPPAFSYRAEPAPTPAEEASHE